MKRVLFISTNNSCRSQIAEGLINHHFNKKIEAFSAGVDKTPVSPYAIKVMKEIGIDISNNTSNTPDDFFEEQFDYIITLCDGVRETCPIFWTKGEAYYKHMGFCPNPKEKTSEEDLINYCRNVRDQIEYRLLKFFDNELRKVMV